MKFTYTLNNIGWADVYLQIGDSEIYIFPSYLSEPLVDLVRSVELLLPECTPQDEIKNIVYFDWDSEPAIHNWKIEMKSQEKIQINIMVYDGGIKTLPGKLEFSEECNLNEFISEVVQFMEALLRDHGILGYRKQWYAQDFPISSYLQLKYYLLNKRSFPIQIRNPNNEWIEKIETSLKDELDILKEFII
ncbi:MULTISPECIES: hypothetical protein [Paenibacillus]|uniref:hypothetical protein n=1 Tax=Paenibacillus TaxID=44249 RepID=UPI0011A9CDAC|nr:MULTISPECIES: hypothetical protein [Paenibacillus]MDR6715505.1 hypothetical protein [Paenibacillus sp. 2003]